jgi:hypothetical protein
MYVTYIYVNGGFLFMIETVVEITLISGNFSYTYRQNIEQNL